MGLHLLLLLPWPSPFKAPQPEVRIPISLLPAPEPKPEERPAPSRRRATTPNEPARKEPVRPREPAEAKIPPRSLEPPQPPTAPQPEERPNAAARIVTRPLPSLKELMPPPGFSSRAKSAETAGPVRLDTREAKYVPYFETIKRAIEEVWIYPEEALRSRHQGRLLVEFTVLQDGELEGPRLVRSSGYPELDQEALRAIRAAAPFAPIPPSLGRSRIDIVASFEYYDNRLRYEFRR